MQAEFERASDRVAQWMDEELFVVTEYDGKPVKNGSYLPIEEAATAQRLTDWFDTWAVENRLAGMGRNKLVKRLLTKEGVVNVRRGPQRQKALNLRELTKEEREEREADTFEGEADPKVSAPKAQVKGGVESGADGSDAFAHKTSPEDEEGEGGVLERSGAEASEPSALGALPPVTSGNGADTFANPFDEKPSALDPFDQTCECGTLAPVESLHKAEMHRGGSSCPEFKRGCPGLRRT